MDTTPDTQLSLAPGAGSGIGRKLALSLLDDSRFLPALRDAFMDALTATTWYFDTGSKTRVLAIDYKTRLAAAMGVLSHMEGDPVKRIIHQEIGMTNLAGAAEDQLAASPGLRAALARQLRKAEERAKCLPQPEPKRVEAIDLPE
jgi:hypothetical protein